MTDLVEVTDEDRIRTIRFNRPDRKNALTHAMYKTIHEALTSAQGDPSVRVVVLTGAGDAFTAGNDMQDFVGAPPDLTGGEKPPVYHFLRALLTAEKPLAAIVNGVAVGVGATMLLHCDFVYVAKSAKISAPFADLGLVPEAASSLLMPMIVGQRRAAEMFMLGDRLSGDEAATCGLANQAFDDDTCVDQAMARLRLLAAKPPKAIRQAKMLMKRNIAQAAERMDEEDHMFAKGLKGPEFAEAAAAFLQKRSPNFDQFD